MAYNEIPILHRAFELARSGQYTRVKDLEKALAAEGYARADPQIHSPSVRKQLRLLCREAGTACVTGASPSAAGAEQAEAGA